MTAGPTDVDRVFRQVYGQAVATLVRLGGDITLAEDAVQDAFVVASERWPQDGIPPNPAGWIVTTARNRAIDVARRATRGRELQEQLATTAPEAAPVCPMSALALVTMHCSPSWALKSRLNTRDST